MTTVVTSHMSHLGRQILAAKRERAKNPSTQYPHNFWALTAKINALARTAAKNW